MQSMMRVLSFVLLWLCFLLILVQVTCWIPPAQLPSSDPCSAGRCLRPKDLYRYSYDEYPTFLHGGYYEDPKTDPSVEFDHMVFGIPCRDVKVVVNGVEFTNLVPVVDQTTANSDGIDTTNRNDAGEEDAEHQHGKRILDYIESHDEEESLFVDASVLDIGCSSGGLAAALALGASSVTVCHTDHARLRVLEHALTLLNTNVAASTGNGNKCTFRTVALDDTDQPLPSADIVMITASNMDVDIAKTVHQIVNDGGCSRVLIPAELISEDELKRQHYIYDQQPTIKGSSGEDILDIRGRE